MYFLDAVSVYGKRVFSVIDPDFWIASKRFEHDSRMIEYLVISILVSSLLIFDIYILLKAMRRYLEEKNRRQFRAFIDLGMFVRFERHPPILGQRRRIFRTTRTIPRPCCFPTITCKLKLDPPQISTPSTCLRAYSWARRMESR
uniref:DUF4389 domain-containing protein n=1 Tax=Panagrellus redivivus TaxID=6233 RepID=A0A7E4VI26_PANRE